MHRTLVPKIFLIIAMCAALPVFAQTKPSAEVDVVKCWERPLGDEAASALASDGVRLYLGGGASKIDALSLEGSKMWATELGGDIGSNLLATDAGLFLVTTTGSDKTAVNTLRSLSRETGITNWTLKLPDAGEQFLGAYKDSLLVVSKTGVVRSVDAKTGAVRWKREIAEGFAAKPVFGGDKLMLATTAKQVFVIMAATGEIDSMRKTPNNVTAVGHSPDGGDVIGDEHGDTMLFTGVGEKPLWKFRSGGEVSAIFPTDGHIVVTSHDNFAYSLSTRNGSVAWKRRLAGRMAQIATYEDRFVIISSYDEHGAVIVDLTTGKVAGRITLGEEESLTYSPVVADGLIFIITNRAAYTFGLAACPAKKEGGPERS